MIRATACQPGCRLAGILACVALLESMPSGKMHGARISVFWTRCAIPWPTGARTAPGPGYRRTPVGLGFRRLAIIDLSPAAMQPMSNEDDSVWVVFNGEIYNHADIRAELERTGNHRRNTDHSDTEVILHADQEWGIECLQRFRGMFAIALWDARAQALWLIRDRIGIKPLYYSIHGGRVVFASEIKALLQDPDQKRAVTRKHSFIIFRF